MAIGLFYIIVPLILIGVIAYQKQPNIYSWILTILSFGLVILYLWATARWEIVSIYFRPLFPVLFIIAAIISYRRQASSKKGPNKITVIINLVIHVILIVFFAGLNWFTFKGYSKPTNSIDLSWPFHEGKQIVLHGGRSPFTNGHYHVRPQNYALDIVGLNSLGMRANSFSGGSDLNNYEIFGVPVYSPSHGVVVQVVDEFEDLEPPNTDIENLAGNYVLIESDGVEILLAHLKRGSILVNVGDKVSTDTMLGQVGNTGNTSEPHLHIHVEKDGEPQQILDGKGVPFSINQKFLVRGSKISNNQDSQ